MLCKDCGFILANNHITGQCTTCSIKAEKENADQDFNLKMLDATEKDLEDPAFLYNVAEAIGHRLEPKYENIIKKKTTIASLYAIKILVSRWPEAEKYIMNNTRAAYEYATEILKTRWIKAEQTIKNDKYYWDQYKKHFKI